MFLIRLLVFISQLISIYMFVLIAAAVLSWLLVFNVVNIRNPAVTTISNILYQLTEPLLKPIRRWVPNYGGLDLSFIVLWVFLLFITNVIIPSLIAAL